MYPQSGDEIQIARPKSLATCVCKTTSRTRPVSMDRFIVLFEFKARSLSDEKNILLVVDVKFQPNITLVRDVKVWNTILSRILNSEYQKKCYSNYSSKLKMSAEYTVTYPEYNCQENTILFQLNEWSFAC